MDAWYPDLSTMAFAVPAVLFAGISKGGFGSSAAFAAATILAVVLEPKAALGIMLPLLMLMDSVALKSFWGKWHGPSAWTLILGGLPGVVLGAAFSQAVNPDALRFLIGSIAIVFVIWHLAGARGWISVQPAPFTRAKGLGTGVFSGFTSYVSHAGGPPVAMFLLAQRMDKTVYQATTVIAFTAINVFKAVPYAFLGFFTAETLLLDLWLAPVAALGAWIGVRAHHLVPEQIFFAITYVLLMLTGGKLIFDALT